jgi:putative transposase
MPRISRAVAVGYPHHLTQRGNYRQTVFAKAEDYGHYLELLGHYAQRHDLEIWAYCLMPNHVHLVGVPQAEDSLAKVFHCVHMLYSQYVNRKTEAAGPLWQGRFYSCVLDDAHVYAAVRYGELNPVRSGLADMAEAYPWSSAKSHVAGTADPVLRGKCFLTERIADWRRYLGEATDTPAQERLLKATKTGRPCGSEEFVATLETVLNRSFAIRPCGRHRLGWAAGRPEGEEKFSLGMAEAGPEAQK